MKNKNNNKPPSSLLKPNPYILHRSSRMGRLKSMTNRVWFIIIIINPTQPNQPSSFIMTHIPKSPSSRNITPIFAFPHVPTVQHMTHRMKQATQSSSSGGLAWTAGVLLSSLVGLLWWVKSLWGSGVLWQRNYRSRNMVWWRIFHHKIDRNMI
jgi:hypothetical protein